MVNAMNFSDVYAHDKTASEEGTWAPIGGPWKVKVRAFDSAHTRALRTKLEEPYKALARLNKTIPEDDQNEINIKLVAQSSLLDWNLTEGTDEAGKPKLIPFSASKAEELLRGEPKFLRDVIAVLVADETFKKVNREADSKNS